LVGWDLRNKLARLQGLLQAYGKVAVAFSGGVDSTLLLRVACDTLGPENVIALHAASCLIPDSDRLKAELLVTGPPSMDAPVSLASWTDKERPDGIGCPYRAVQVHPLHWPEFVANSEQRCYFCKKNIYNALQAEIRQEGHPAVLLDGTNNDDLQEHRPGLQAIRELGVETPLAEAGLNKKDIRSLARELGLTNWNQPSNSCLATRIPVHQEITLPLLERIAQAEQFLHDRGFTGCRVRPGQHTVVVQVMTSDLERCNTQSSRLELTEYLNHLGFDTLLLDRKGRDQQCPVRKLHTKKHQKKLPVRSFFS